MMAAYQRDPKLRQQYDSGRLRALLRRLLAGAMRGGK
jgi:hypothetical protein